LEVIHACAGTVGLLSKSRGAAETKEAAVASRRNSLRVFSGIRVLLAEMDGSVGAHQKSFIRQTIVHRLTLMSNRAQHEK
jgi:hypothetical protein